VSERIVSVCRVPLRGVLRVSYVAYCVAAMCHTAWQLIGVLHYSYVADCVVADVGCVLGLVFIIFKQVAISWQKEVFLNLISNRVKCKNICKIQFRFNVKLHQSLVQLEIKLNKMYQCCGAGPFLCGSGSSLSKISAPACRKFRLRPFSPYN
jgi:hypothetical protein